MSSGPGAKTMNVAGSEQRPVLGNKSRTSPFDSRKPAAKKSPGGKNNTSPSPSPPSSNSGGAMRTIMRQHSNGHRLHLLRHNQSLNASCSSDASTDSWQSRASTGRIPNSSSRSSSTAAVVLLKKKHSNSNNNELNLKRGTYANNKMEKAVAGADHDGEADRLTLKKRCAWVTPNTDPCYAAFHDQEWGVPVHDDRKLFELLSLSGALAELTWPVILSKRDKFREVFFCFDPVAVSNMNEKKIAVPGSPGHSLLSELKLRVLIDNARQVCKIINEFGSFDQYIWGFVNQKPIVSQFRHPRQVPIKTPKADVISKDLVKRGLRGVGPTVVYSFMQAAGLTNDHLISCFRFEECVAVISDGVERDPVEDAAENRRSNGVNEVKLELPRGLDEISQCSDL